MPKKKNAPEEFSFEEALGRLEDIVQKLEGDELTLEEALEFFRTGVELAGVCSGKLTAVQQEVQKIVEDSKGEFALRPLDLSES
ncbi:MAG: exodeoxyribonuclease VII small subunit [Acidaminococcales bacterium]|jgi:exodeoxyribonuclease VII small subunit|nr:exodeoxyribonuclease VII small subunit [Acidaminococcales bacterium]